jgi:hypothetical protein
MTSSEIETVKRQAVDSWMKLGGALLAVAVSQPRQDIANEMLDRTAKPVLVNTLALAVVSILCA